MATANAQKWTVLARLSPYLRQHTGRLVLGFLFVLSTNVLLAMFPKVIGFAVDGLHGSITRQKLGYYSIILISLALCEGFCRFWMRWLLIGVSRDIEYSLRNDLFSH